MNCTLSIIINDKNQFLLGEKKRGFGKGILNGPGGKQEVGETMLETAIRETIEEVGIDLTNNIEEVGLLHFRFLQNPEWNQEVYLFLSKNINQTPIETEEMIPFWFDIDKIPYDRMWQDDKFWLPRVLVGEKVEYEFVFDGDNLLEYKEIK